MIVDLEERLRACLAEHADRFEGVDSSRLEAEIERRVAAVDRRRRARRWSMLGVAAATVLGVVGVVAWAAGRDEPDRLRVISPSVPATTAPDQEDPPGPDTAPGTWRTLAPAPPNHRTITSTWTGREAVLLGMHVVGSGLRTGGLAYDVATDRWRKIATPPAGAWDLDRRVADPPDSAWTGSVVLVASRARVLTYDPDADRWDERAASPPGLEGVEVSPRGVVGWSADGWWWYDVESDAWHGLPSPPSIPAAPVVVAVDADTFAMPSADGLLVLDATAGAWRRAGPLEARSTDACGAVAGRLLCWWEPDFSGTTSGVVVDPNGGQRRTFERDFGNHATVWGGFPANLPWFAHSWPLYDPRTGEWEDVEPYGDGGFEVAVWTGREILAFGWTPSDTLPGESGEPNPHALCGGCAVRAAAYTPRTQPGSPGADGGPGAS